MCNCTRMQLSQVIWSLFIEIWCIVVGRGSFLILISLNRPIQVFSPLDYMYCTGYSFFFSSIHIFLSHWQHVDHLSWLGLYKDISCGTSLQPFWNKHGHSGKKTAEHCQRVFDKFLKMRSVNHTPSPPVHHFHSQFCLLCSNVQITNEVKAYLKKPTFDNWQWDDPEMMILLRHMYIDLGLTTSFNIDVSTPSSGDIHSHHLSISPSLGNSRNYSWKRSNDSLISSLSELFLLEMPWQGIKALWLNESCVSLSVIPFIKPTAQGQFKPYLCGVEHPPFFLICCWLLGLLLVSHLASNGFISVSEKPFCPRSHGLIYSNHIRCSALISCKYLCIFCPMFSASEKI